LSLQKIESADYDQLLARCKPLVASAKQHATDCVKDNWELGKQLLNVETTYGEGTISKLAKDLTVHPSHLYKCIQFAEQLPQFSAIKISPILDRVENLTWTEIRKRLGEPRKSAALPTKLPTALPINPPATPEELRHAYDPRREPPPKSESKPALLFREILTWLQIPHVSEKEIQVSTERGSRTYIADFFAYHRILEVDSELHDPDKDEQRDKDLLTLGFKTERFLDTDIAITHKTLSRLREIIAIEKVAA